MTKWLSHRMVERGIIKEEEQELYQFGIRNGMILLLNVVTALVIGLLTEQLAVVAVFTLSFMVLRSYTGGYHSDSRIFCYLGSNLVLLVPVYTQAVFYKTSLAWPLAVLLIPTAPAEIPEAVFLLPSAVASLAVILLPRPIALEFSPIA